MDPLSAAVIATVLSGILSGATGETGAMTTRALSRLLRRLKDRGEVATPPEIERAIAAPEPADGPMIAEYLAEAAASDPVARAEVKAWLISANQAITTGAITNSVSGSVVMGSVNQAGVIGDSGKPRQSK